MQTEILDSKYVKAYLRRVRLRFLLCLPFTLILVPLPILNTDPAKVIVCGMLSGIGVILSFFVLAGLFAKPFCGQARVTDKRDRRAYSISNTDIFYRYREYRIRDERGIIYWCTSIAGWDIGQLGKILTPFDVGDEVVYIGIKGTVPHLIAKSDMFKNDIV